MTDLLTLIAGGGVGPQGVPTTKDELIRHLSTQAPVILPNTDVAKDYYEFQDKLGEGSFCKVYKALYKPTEEVIAVKVSVTDLFITFLLLGHQKKEGESK
jgi:serine/threonine protein kinase